MFGAGSSSSDNDYVLWTSNDVLKHSFDTESSGNVIWSAKFRDPSAWQHIVVTVDTTDATAANRVRAYANGIELHKSGESYPSQNYVTSFGKGQIDHRLGARAYSATGHYGGYISEFNFIAGQALKPGHFGEVDPDSPNIWRPKKYNGTYGNMGAYLEFKQSAVGSGSASTIGADTSGNGNHYTSTNVATTDQAIDTCTNNFANLRFHGFPSSKGSITEGGTLWDTTGDGSDSARDLRQQAISNIGVASGKWYAEFKHTEDQNGLFIGVSNMSNKLHTEEIESYAYIYTDSGNLYQREKTGASESNAAHGGSSNSLNDIYMIALDMDNTNVYFGKNGQWASGSGAWDQSNPTSAYSISSDFINTDSHRVVVFNCSGAGSSETPAVQANFGSPTYSISSGNADANGHGNFEYAVPSGYFALCTKNLAQYG